MFSTNWFAVSDLSTKHMRDDRLAQHDWLEWIGLSHTTNAKDCLGWTDLLELINEMNFPTQHTVWERGLFSATWFDRVNQIFRHSDRGSFSTNDSLEWIGLSLQCLLLSIFFLNYSPTYRCESVSVRHWSICVYVRERQ